VVRGDQNIIKGFSSIDTDKAPYKSVMDLRLELRVGVFTDVKNNGMRGTRGFIQVQSSLWIKTLCPVCVSVL
jgi:hypothetical protein